MGGRKEREKGNEGEEGGRERTKVSQAALMPKVGLKLSLPVSKLAASPLYRFQNIHAMN